jgi:hypothetical protein
MFNTGRTRRTTSCGIQAPSEPSKLPAALSMTAAMSTASAPGRSPTQSNESRSPISMPCGREQDLRSAELQTEASPRPGPSPDQSAATLPHKPTGTGNRPKSVTYWLSGEDQKAPAGEDPPPRRDTCRRCTRSTLTERASRGQIAKVAFPPVPTFGLPGTKVSNGARIPIPALPAECPLCDRRGDLCRDARQRARPRRLRSFASRRSVGSNRPSSAIRLLSSKVRRCALASDRASLVLHD